MNYKDAIASRRIMKILDIRNIEYGLYLDVREKFISLKQGFITPELRRKSLAEFASIIKPMIDDLMEHDLEIWKTISARKGDLTANELHSIYNAVVYNVIRGREYPSPDFRTVMIEEMNNPQRPRTIQEWHERVLFGEEVESDLG